MSSDSQMPWELLRGDTLKAIFKDLGLNQYVGKREDMLGHLQEVEKDGRMYTFSGVHEPYLIMGQCSGSCR